MFNFQLILLHSLTRKNPYESYKCIAPVMGKIVCSVSGKSLLFSKQTLFAIFTRIKRRKSFGFKW